MACLPTHPFIHPSEKNNKDESNSLPLLQDTLWSSTFSETDDGRHDDDGDNSEASDAGNDDPEDRHGNVDGADERDLSHRRSPTVGIFP